MTTTKPKSITVSAPGKILLAGGYLVLERPNVGLVVAADKRFYTTVTSLSSSNASSNTNKQQQRRVVVTSPQFHAQWEYVYEHDQLTACPSNSSTNPFVEKSLRLCFLYLKPPPLLTTDLHITIRADNDFYSLLPHLNNNNELRSLANVQKLDRFLNCPRDETSGKALVHKTGLGSSAALTTSLVGALVQYYSDLDDLDNDDDSPKDASNNTTMIIHNLAQICHCHAQGKVGSGFDVSSAIHGTHVYRRFPKCLLPDLLQQLDHDETQNQNEHGSNSSAAALLTKLVELDEWTQDMVTPLELSPKGDIQILLADVCGGSESPSMAKAVLQWKQTYITTTTSNSTTTAIPHWDDLKQLNATVVDLIQSLNNGTTTSTTTSTTIDYDALSHLPASQWHTITTTNTNNNHPLVALHTTFQQIRHHLKEMGIAAGVPIEPDAQTKLCNATMELPGVIAALVPGAGGYDAICVLYIDRPSVVAGIGQLWEQWKEPLICPLAVQLSTEGGWRVEQYEYEYEYE